MEQTFDTGYSTPGTSNSNSMSDGAAVNPGDNRSDSRSSMATSVERAVDTGAARVHGAVDVSKDALHAGVRRADAAVADLRDRTGTALTELQQKANDTASRITRNPQVEELTRNLEVQVRDHPVRTLAIAIGLGVLVGRSLK